MIIGNVKELKVFVDGSCHTVSGVGYGAYLLVEELLPSYDKFDHLVKLRRFEHTSSTKLELQTLLWALSDLQLIGGKVTIYTDSQNITRLNERRSRLEQTDFRSKKGEPLKHSALYREFYRMMDLMHCEFIKVKGHRKSHHKNEVDQLFTLVDRASRKALRSDSL